jgi:basic membrane protein A and related proteins
MRDGVRRLRTVLPVVAAVVIVVVVAACGSSGKPSSSTGNASAPSTGKEIKVGAALIGPKNDGSFNQATYQGILAAEKVFPQLKLTATLENRTTDATRTDALDTLSPLNKLVMAVSASFGPILDQEAAKFPNTYYITVAGYTNKYHPNVTGLANDWGAPAYVGGVIAAHMTKSNIVGYVGGAEIPPTTQAAAAFAAGAKSVKPSIKVLSNITGDFNDVAMAKAATASMITDGADVIFPFLDAGIAGSYAAGKASGKDPAMFKLTIPDCTSYDNIVGTEVVDDQAMTQRLITSYIHGTLKPGAIFLDLQDPTLQTMKLCPKYQANPMVSSVTKQTIAAINSGKTKLPTNAINPRPSYPHSEGFPAGG